MKRLCTPVEGALTLLTNSESILKGYQSELKALLAMLRLRLFQTLALLPANALEGSYAQLLRLLVSKLGLFSCPKKPLLWTGKDQIPENIKKFSFC